MRLTGQKKHCSTSVLLFSFSVRKPGTILIAEGEKNKEKETEV